MSNSEESAIQRSVPRRRQILRTVSSISLEPIFVWDVAIVPEVATVILEQTEDSGLPGDVEE